MPNILGVSDSLVLISNNEKGAVVDTQYNIIVETGDARELFASKDWQKYDGELTQAVVDLAEGALTSLDIKIVASAGRLYTIPKGVQNEAKKALE